MTKVCCFCETWGTGGIESFLINLFENLVLKNLEIDIVTAELQSEVNLERIRRMGIGFYQLSGSTRRFLTNGRIFRRLVHERGYDVIHLNIYHAFSLRYIHIAEEEGICRRIAHSHGSGLRPSATRLLKIVLHRLASRQWSSCVTDWWACSEKAARFMYPSPYMTLVSFVHDGIPTARYAYNPEVRCEVRQRLKMSDCFILGQIGRLSSEKNQSFTLDIFAKLLRRCPEARLLLIGDGGDRNRLMRKAFSLGITQSTIFYGFTHSICELMQAIDMLILPSLFEGLGIVAIEAQAAGLPVLCSSGVPLETNITGLLEYLPLSFGEEMWAEHIRDARGTTRQDGSAMVLKAGYDAKQTAEQVRRIYLGIEEQDE